MNDSTDRGFPETLDAFLDRGGVLDDEVDVVELEKMARVIVIGSHLSPLQDRAGLAEFLVGSAARLIGDRVQLPVGTPCLSDDEWVELRRLLWMAAGLMDAALASRFEAGLPEPLRSVCLKRVEEVRRSGTYLRPVVGRNN